MLESWILDYCGTSLGPVQIYIYTWGSAERLDSGESIDPNVLHLNIGLVDGLSCFYILSQDHHAATGLLGFCLVLSNFPTHKIFTTALEMQFLLEAMLLLPPSHPPQWHMLFISVCQKWITGRETQVLKCPGNLSSCSCICLYAMAAMELMQSNMTTKIFSEKKVNT